MFGVSINHLRARGTMTDASAIARIADDLAHRPRVRRSCSVGTSPDETRRQRQTHQTDNGAAWQKDYGARRQAVISTMDSEGLDPHSDRGRDLTGSGSRKDRMGSSDSGTHQTVWGQVTGFAAWLCPGTRNILAFTFLAIVVAMLPF